MTEAATRILVVDDNPVNVRILTRSLQKAGYEVSEAYDGFRAVDIATEVLPDVILLDIMMPGRNGLEVCSILKAQPSTSHIPIIFVTAQSDPEEVVKAFTAGGSDYVSKPLRPAEILARVSVQVRLRKAEQELVSRNEMSENLATELAKTNEELALLSRVDPLTKLLNRRAWGEAANQEYDRARRNNTEYGIIMMDVDYFKRFNDTLGHQAGDECLKKVAAAVTTASRTMDIIGRYGGEEFVILIPEADLGGAHIVAERIRTAIWELSIEHPGSEVDTVVTASLGVASGDGSVPLNRTISQADDAMYVSKKKGRNLVSTSQDTFEPPEKKCIQPSTTRKSAVGENSTGAKVLLVCANQADATRFEQDIASECGQVFRVSSDDAVLKRAMDHNPNVIVIVDSSPQVNSTKCIRSLKRNAVTNNMPIVVIAEDVDVDNKQSLIDAGADECLTQECTKETIARCIRLLYRVDRVQLDLLESYQWRGEHSRSLNLLVDLCDVLASNSNLEEALQRIAVTAAELACCRRISIMLPDAERKYLRIVESIGISDEVIEKTKIPMGSAVAGKVYETGSTKHTEPDTQAISVDQYHGTKVFASIPLICVPIGFESRIVGVLNLTDRADDKPFTDQESEYVELFCKISGSAIHGILSEMSRDEARDSIMLGLAKLAEHRDTDTGKHLDRVTQYCQMLAEELAKSKKYESQIDEAFMADLERAVPLHDIGKVAIPDSILLKPGKLNEAELSVMKTHAEMGTATIRSIIESAPGVTFLEMAAEVANFHHEWFDGNGYPCGLRGQSIPLAARIATVADVYDALTTKRVYKDAFTHERSSAIITELSGTQFDPDVIEAFLGRENDFATLAHELADDDPCESKTVTHGLTDQPALIEQE